MKKNYFFMPVIFLLLAASQAGAQGMNTTVTTPSNMNSQQFSSFATSRWDTNRNGVLSRPEWNSINPSWFSGTARSSFNALDRNHNGTLDSMELQTVFSNSSFFQMFDANGDGVIDSTEAARIPAQ
jgi:hypothetical protein